MAEGDFQATATPQLAVVERAARLLAVVGLAVALGGCAMPRPRSSGSARRASPRTLHVTYSYRIEGNVQRPGIYELARPVTVGEAIEYAGGFRFHHRQANTYPSHALVTVVRRASNRDSVAFLVRLPTLNPAAPEGHVFLESGDRVVVR